MCLCSVYSMTWPLPKLRQNYNPSNRFPLTNSGEMNRSEHLRRPLYKQLLVINVIKYLLYKKVFILTGLPDSALNCREN